MSEAADRVEMERRLLEDPKGAVEEELGTRLPEVVRTIYLVLPSASPVGQGGELSDRDVEAVAGGSTWGGETCDAGNPDC
jgi:hypothetical protein